MSTFIKASASRTARVVRKKVLPGLGPATIAVSEFGFILRHRVVLALCTGGLDPPPVCVGGGVWVWHRRQASPSPPMGGGCGTGRWLRPVTIYSLFLAVPQLLLFYSSGACVLFFSLVLPLFYLIVIL